MGWSPSPTARPPPHGAVIPYPAEGHVIPLMDLSHRLVDRSFSVTFVNTHFDHARLLASLPGPRAETGPLRLVSIPNGLEPCADHNDI
ncbi:UDP-glycosyltransferase 83A1 [Acorus calamus]|uniref:UDP-glycosyltransferase 83A1 n=1 Tax=Acorus calamus TaxID=4465 RepID=A0AAV9E5N1_ACOCL|nr:UDP-glycosyltransferase 83A1 [Acorus calamus]